MAERDIRTLTVLGSQVVARADGRVAIAFQTQQCGPIALEVNLQAIQILRSDLAKAEAILRNQGNA